MILLLLCLVTLVECEKTTPNNTTPTGGDDGECLISSINEDFLVRKCTNNLPNVKVLGEYTALGSTRMSCIGSPTVTFVITRTCDLYARTLKTFVDRLCPDDPTQYQACGASGYIPARARELFRTPPACGVLCFDPEVHLYRLHETLQECPSARVQVRYTIRTVGGGEVEVWMKEGALCDGVCDDIEIERPGQEERSKAEFLLCVDERDCNGYSYGAVVQTEGEYYLEPFNRVPPTVANVTCNYIDIFDVYLFPLNNGTRCFIPLPSVEHITGYFLPSSPSYCSSSLDQTNCTDPDKVAGSCLVNGYPTTVSIHVLCPKYGTSYVCDDRIETKCPTINRQCTIQKHLLCNSRADCAEGADEKIELCSKLTKQRCVRSFSQNEGLLPIPVEWVQDGVVDCLDGQDERKEWETCGKGTRKRVKYLARQCSDVFLCKEDRTRFLELPFLCSFPNKCDEGVCNAGKTTVSRKLISSKTVNGQTLKSVVCNNGLENLLRLKGETCNSTIFSHLFHEFFGKNFTTELVLLSEKQDCRYLYGETTVYHSVKGLIASCLKKYVIWLMIVEVGRIRRNVLTTSNVGTVLGR
eukprot:sb/3479724/